MSKINQTIQVGDLKIGGNHEPVIVAEMSGNHNGSLQRALEIVDAAARGGAHAFKLQTYTADTMTINCSDGDFMIQNPSSPWHGESLYKLYQRASTPWKWHSTIQKRCHELGLLFFSTPFDLSAVDYLEELDVPMYKVASFEILDHSLIARIAQTKKPMIISTGMASQDEIYDAVKVARNNGCNDLILLKCTSLYPSRPEVANLLTIPDMRDRFGCQVGLSDHTLGIGVAVTAVALGVVMIEKHLTLSRAEDTVDAAFSLEPHEMKALVLESKTTWESLGRVTYGPVGPEVSSLKFRRSLYFVQDIRKDEVFTKENVRAIRPNLGLPPKHYEKLLGKRASCDIKRGTPAQWDLVKR